MCKYKVRHVFRAIFKEHTNGGKLVSIEEWGIDELVDTSCRRPVLLGSFFVQASPLMQNLPFLIFFDPKKMFLSIRILGRSLTW